MFFRTLARTANNPMNPYYAILLFLVVAVFFSVSYSVILPYFEGSSSLSHNMKGAVRPDTVTFADCLYFSVTTQTTIGYGDIVPSTVLGKISAMIQSVFGFFYLAFMVSLFMARRLLRSKRTERVSGDREVTGKILRLH